MNRRYQSVPVLVWVIVLLLCVTSDGIGQSGDWKFGFDIGWSNSKIQGDVESSTTIGGETQKFNAGFHLSFYGRRYYTDLFGIQVGLAYAQRGGRLEYDGDSYYVFGIRSTSPVNQLVRRIETTKILNGYLDIPIMAFHKIGSKFEVGAGVYGGLLVSSKGDGEIRISPRSSGGPSFDPFVITTDYKYFRNNFGEDASGQQTIRVIGTNFDEPRTIGAYHEFFEEPGKEYFNRVDFGLMAQAGFYLNESLNIKGKIMYGLTDLTRTETDVAHSTLSPDSKFILRVDKDKNISMQISLGFLF